jgi:hypothetical protein
MEVIKLISQLWVNVFNSFAGSNTDLMSSDAKRIFSNFDDRKKYIDAVEKLRQDPDKPQKIVLSNKEEITLVS